MLLRRQSRQSVAEFSSQLLLLEKETHARRFMKSIRKWKGFGCITYCLLNYDLTDRRVFPRELVAETSTYHGLFLSQKSNASCLIKEAQK